MSLGTRLASHALLVSLALLIPIGARLRAQAIVAAWGNVEGMRVQGDVVPFETSVCLADSTGAVRARTARERQMPRFARAGSRRTITTRLGGYSITEIVEDVRPGDSWLDVAVTTDSAMSVRPFLCVDASAASYASVSIDGSRAMTKGFSYVEKPSPTRRRVRFDLVAATPILLSAEHREGRDFLRVLVPLATADTGGAAHTTLTIHASGVPDRTPVTLGLDRSRPGRVWDGLGGNFRIQNARLDPPIIEYNLANLRVAWARVEMPWRTWHPDSSMDPAARDTAQQDPRVRAAMAMARTAAQRGMPVIVSAWFPPQWAVLGPLPRNGAPVNGVRGNALDPAKTDRIYASITSYLQYLKAHYGVEAWAFSFNESDLGIDVRQTPQEHVDLIKGLGAYLKAHGLGTKLLLGDVSDATPTRFIEPALQDSSSWPYVAAVSYHSWRGWSDSLLTFWSDAAKRIGVPLLVGEGSVDAGAYRYPQIFQEEDFALPEIALYVRILALSEPKSILQWQLTSDYSLLTGGGLYGDSTALRPTQRFWNLKQLASVPGGLSHLPITCGGTVQCAALGNEARGTYAVHVVNPGAGRSAVVTGLPRGARSLRMWTTSASRNMVEGARVAVRGGVARFALPSASYVTLLAEGSK